MFYILSSGVDSINDVKPTCYMVKVYVLLLYVQMLTCYMIEAEIFYVICLK